MKKHFSMVEVRFQLDKNVLVLYLVFLEVHFHLHFLPQKSNSNMGIWKISFAYDREKTSKLLKMTYLIQSFTLKLM